MREAHAILTRPLDLDAVQDSPSGRALWGTFTASQARARLAEVILVDAEIASVPTTLGVGHSLSVGDVIEEPKELPAVDGFPVGTVLEEKDVYQVTRLYDGLWRITRDDAGHPITAGHVRTFDQLDFPLTVVKVGGDL